MDIQRLRLLNSLAEHSIQHEPMVVLGTTTGVVPLRLLVARGVSRDVERVWLQESGGEDSQGRER